MHTNSVQSKITSVLGLILLVPASYFLFTLLVRLFGSTTLYYSVAPSFLESVGEMSSFHISTWILFGPILACMLNALAILRFRFFRESMPFRVQIFYRNYWLNTAIAIQSLLMIVVVLLYLVIEHYRYS